MTHDDQTTPRPPEDDGPAPDVTAPIPAGTPGGRAARQEPAATGAPAGHDRPAGPAAPERPGARPGPRGATAVPAATAGEQLTAPVRVSARVPRAARVSPRAGHVVPVTSDVAEPEDVVEPTLRPGVVPPLGSSSQPAASSRGPSPDTGPSPDGPHSPGSAPHAPTPLYDASDDDESPARAGTVPLTTRADGRLAGSPRTSPGPESGATDGSADAEGGAAALFGDDAEPAGTTPPREPDEEPVPPVRLGVLVSPRLTELLGDGLLHLDTVLRDAVGGDAWDVTVVADPVADRGPSALDTLEASRDRLLDEDWDLAVVLTAVPLLDARRAVVTRSAPVHGVGLVSVPALGAVHVRSRTRGAVARLVGELLDVRVIGDAAGAPDAEGPPDADRLRGRLRQLTADDDAAAPGGVRLAARVLGSNAGLLVAMVRANRPWRLLAPLSRALTAAGAAAVLTLVTTDLWLLADAFGPGRLLLLAVLSVVAVSVALVGGAHLWERPRRTRERRQVTLFNLATAGTVLVGVLVLHVALLLLALLGVALLVDAGVLAGVLGREPDGGTWWRLAWLTASLATVAGAIGAGLEDDDAVRAAAYTRSQESADEVAADRDGSATTAEDEAESRPSDRPGSVD